MPRHFYTILEEKCSNLRPLFSITFPQGFEISKYFGHWTLGSVGIRTVKRSEQMRRKKICKKLFLTLQFYTIFEQKSSNLRPFLSITFCQGFRISKKLGHWTSGSWSKNTVKLSERTDKHTKQKQRRNGKILHQKKQKVRF